MGPVRVSSIGEYIRQQREQAKISLRQLASAAGVSNPYLSQIERGLRRPSAEILQQIAKGLRISAEALYVQAGILEDRHPDSGVRAAVLADPDLAERQKQVLLEIYESFRRESALNAGSPPGATADLASGAEAKGPDLSPRSVGSRARAKGPDLSPRSVGSRARNDGAGNDGAGNEGAGNEGAGNEGAGSTGSRSTGTGPGSRPAPAIGQEAQTVRRTGDAPHGTNEKSAGAEAPARDVRGPARAAGQGG
jgi:transcriptional regulator with XRE-family HTH domain